jgi:hypothetical protein
MRKVKRVISKSKMYGFNPWVDQLDAINQIMEQTGEKSESAVLRKLIDEALAARHMKVAQAELSESQPHSVDDSIQIVQTLLLRLIRQGETSLRIQDVSLALLQDTLAEAYAGRKVSWSLAVPGLAENGLGPVEIAKRFEQETSDAKNHAYGIADEIKKSQGEHGGTDSE